jgi:hypothetical protein
MWRWSSRSARSALLLAATCALAPSARAGDDGWTPLREADGVRVLERAAPDRALPELRGEVEIAAPLARVLAVIEDVPGQTKWMHTCSEARVVRRESGSVSLVYNRTDSPWPVSDRDAVLRTVIDPRGPETALVRFDSVADPAAPPVDGVVRMPRLAGSFALAALGAERTRVVYELDVDPGGALPSWLAASTARDLPFETLRGLRREATRALAGERPN